MGRKITKTKIDWCDYVWNPVWGCLNNCEYCYAKKIAKRFARKIAWKEVIFEFKFTGKRVKESTLYQKEYEIENKIYDFEPVWLKRNYNKEFPVRPSRIFVNSMSEIYFWEKEWMQAVLDKIKQYPQHTFIFLSKFPQSYDTEEIKFPNNCWLGLTIDKKISQDEIKLQIWASFNAFFKENITFVSFEPLNFNPEFVWEYISEVNWIIVGAQTNPYIPPQKKWVLQILEMAKKLEIPVFLKDNLYRAYPDLPLIKEFPVNENMER